MDMKLAAVLARVLGGGAHDLSWWCWVRYWLPYAIGVALVLWAACRSFGSCYERDLW